jgi:hypothetical protein
MSGMMEQIGARGPGRAVKELKITYHGGGLMMASFEPVCIAVWESQPTPALFEIQRSHLAATVKGYPGRAAFMCVVSQRADPPEQEVRDASSKMIAGHAGKLTGCACVIEGSGFRSAITRTVLTGILFVVRSPVPYLFCESVTAACTWLEARGTRERLTGLIEQLDQARASGRRP